MQWNLTDKLILLKIKVTFDALRFWFLVNIFPLLLIFTVLMQLSGICRTLKTSCEWRSHAEDGKERLTKGRARDLACVGVVGVRRWERAAHGGPGAWREQVEMGLAWAAADPGTGLCCSWLTHAEREKAPPIAAVARVEHRAVLGGCCPRRRGDGCLWELLARAPWR